MRADRVTVLRKYRSGEIPDIQIKLDDVLKPLQHLALKDSLVSKLMLNVVFRAVIALKGNKAEGERNSMDETIRAEMIKMLETGEESSDLVGGILMMAKTAELRLPARQVATACQRAKTWYDGIMYLEAQAPKVLSHSTRVREHTEGRLSLQKKSTDQKEEDEWKQDEWKQLSLLYKDLEETDTVRGLYDKFSRHLKTKQALMHELEGRYDAAKCLYEELLIQRDRVNQDAWASELEQDLWEDGFEDCMRKAHMWEPLKNWYTDKVLDGGKDDTFDDDIWTKDNRKMLGLHLSRLIGTCSITSPTSNDNRDWVIFPTLIDEVWFNPNFGGDRKTTLQHEFPHETALGLLIRKPPARSDAKMLINRYFEHFLDGWPSSSETGQVARRSKIRVLQNIVQILEYNEMSIDGKSRQLMTLWGSRLPRKGQMGDAESWDAILISRMVMLQKLAISCDAR